MGKFKYKDVTISFIGHAAFRIDVGNVKIYTDPYRLPDKPDPADIILITHSHYDHCDSSEVQKIANAATVILTTEDARKKLKGNVKALGQNEETTAKGIKIRAMPAYNVGKPYHPMGFGIGFIISTSKTRIYFAGDTDFTQEMEHLQNIDVCLVPIGGKYTMDEKEAADFVNHIKPKVAIPMHYSDMMGDPVKFKKLVDPSIDVEIMA